MFTLILTCAGNSSRAKCDKMLFEIESGVTVLQKTLSAFLPFEEITHIIITTSEKNKTAFENIACKMNINKHYKIVLGGTSRTKSVFSALKEVETPYLLVHDGARCFVSDKIIRDCIEKTQKFGSAISCYEQTNTTAQCENEKIVNILGKENILTIQTPQGFKSEQLLYCYNNNSEDFPDDSSIFLKEIAPPHISLGLESNKKLTFKSDLVAQFKVGVGYDMHKLVVGRKLILGGVEIAHDKGLLGHSDADVLCHALMDGILSAINKRDIGFHFPDSDERFLNADSTKLLQIVLSMMNDCDYKISNIALVLLAEKPKLKDIIEDIVLNLAKIMNIKKEQISIGATTLEGLGTIGREEGIACHCNVMLEKI